MRCPITRCAATSCSYTVTGVDGKVRRTVDIALPAQTMMHDFSLTEKYVVIYDLPVALDLATVVSSAPARAAARLLTRFADPPRRTGLRAARRDARIRARVSRRLVRDALPLGARTTGPRRGDAARGHRRRHPVVRREPVLRVPPAQRLRRRPGDSIVLDVVRHPSVFTTGHAIVPGRPDAGPLDRRPHHRQGRRGAPRRHVAGIPSGRRATGRPPAPLRILGRHSPPERRVSRARCDPQARSRHATHPVASSSGQAANPASSSSCRPVPDAAEDDGVVMGFVYDRIHRPQ